VGLWRGMGYAREVSLHLCVLLWPNAGAETGLVAYEDRVLELMGDHGARVLQRARTNGADGSPLEIQILEFPSQAALDGYMEDERRTALAAEREAVIARTDVLPVDLL
jgi:uncharacterized protein (DUF1330 family)